MATCFRLLVEPIDLPSSSFGIHLNKDENPLLCRQKEFVLTFESIGNIFHREAALIGQPQQSCTRHSDWPRYKRPDLQ